MAIFHSAAALQFTNLRGLIATAAITLRSSLFYSHSQVCALGRALTASDIPGLVLSRNYGDGLETARAKVLLVRTQHNERH